MVFDAPLLKQKFSKRLDLIEKEQGVTRFMVLLAVFKLLMHRYTDDEDILIGTPVANRQLSDVEPLIGLFVNTVVLRTTINESSSFVSVLQDVKQTCLDAFAHQDIPFETLVDVLQPNRDRSRSPLFQVMFIMQILFFAEICPVLIYCVGGGYD